MCVSNIQTNYNFQIYLYTLGIEELRITSPTMLMMVRCLQIEALVDFVSLYLFPRKLSRRSRHL